jgi:hypothetical protein
MKLAIQLGVAALLLTASPTSVRAGRSSAEFSVSVVLRDACAVEMPSSTSSVAMVTTACSSGRAVTVAADGEPRVGGSGLVRASTARVTETPRRGVGRFEVVTLTF